MVVPFAEITTQHDAGTDVCKTDATQYFVPVSQIHDPGIHSFAGRPSLLLSWPLKKEDVPKPAPHCLPHHQVCKNSTFKT